MSPRQLSARRLGRILGLGFWLVAAAETMAPSTLYGQGNIQTAVQAKNYAVQLHDAGRDREALPYAQQALTIVRSLYGEDHSETVTAYNVVGVVQEGLNDFKGAVASYEQALRIARKNQGEDGRNTVANLNNLGNVWESLGDYSKAREYHEQTLKINRRTRGENHEETAYSYNNLAYVLAGMGHYSLAHGYYQQALRIRQSVLGAEHANTLIVYSNMADLYRMEGDYATARSYYEYVLKMRQRTLGADHPDVANTINALGFVIDLLGDYRTARGYFEQALKLRQKSLGNEHEETAMSFNNVGYVLTELKEYAAARPYYDEALRVRRKLFGDNHPDVANTLNNIGYLLRSQGDFAGARPNYERVLAIQQKALGPDHTGTANAYNNLAYDLMLLGDYEAARENYERALAIQAKALGDGHPSTILYLQNLVDISARLEQWDKAMDYADRARRGVAQHIAKNLPSLSEREQMIFLRVTNARGLNLALSVAAARSNDARSAALSAAWLLNGKAVSQESLAARAVLRRAEEDTQQSAAAKNLADVRRRLATLALTVPQAGKEEIHQKSVAEATAEEERLSRELAGVANRIPHASPWRELAQVREALPADAVFIDIAQYKVINFQAKASEEHVAPAKYAAWIVPPAGKGDVQFVDLGPAEPIDKAVEAVRQAIATAASADGVLRKEGEVAAEEALQPLLKQAANLVWTPIANKLMGAKRLTLSPDGALWLLPWSVLPVAEGKCLIEDYSLQYVLSGRDLLPNETEKVGTSAPVLFADPDFDSPPDKTKQSIAAVYPKLQIADAAPTGTARSLLPRVDRLPNTAIEAETVSPLIRKYLNTAPQPYTNNYALETIVKRVDRPTLLVLSTHGFFLPEQDVLRDDRRAVTSDTRNVPLTPDGKPLENPLLRCGLLLAGCNAKQAADGDDGILTGMEIVGIDLRGTQLVVLSACETGVGKVRNGEGVAGLRQAFQLAGAQSVVASLWQVPDRDSMLIMSDFFQNLAEGQSRTDALRNAQLKRIQARRDKDGAAHPFFWAAWTLTGR